MKTIASDLIHNKKKSMTICGQEDKNTPIQPQIKIFAWNLYQLGVIVVMHIVLKIEEKLLTLTPPKLYMNVVAFLMMLGVGLLSEVSCLSN